MFGFVGLAVLLIGLGAGCCDRMITVEKIDIAPPPGNQLALFSTWPQGVTPDAVLILSGQSFGFVQPCGCSRPQMGGLERRANFIAGLKLKGWPVAGLDLGDLFPDRHPIGPSEIVAPLEQSFAKYVTMMNALREMGYVAVGVGKTEFDARITAVVARYSQQKEQPPFVLAGNVRGKQASRAAFFPAAPGGTRPLVGVAEVAEIGKVYVGVVGLVGPSVAAEAVKVDPSIEFEVNKEVLYQVIGGAVDGLATRPKVPEVTVLLYQGTTEEAKKLAADWPQFKVILCRANDSEPPLFPEFVTHPNGQKTMLVEVGHKGRHVGVVGLFQKPGGGYDLKYQLVGLGEEYLTPEGPEAAKANRALVLLEDYARFVKEQNFLAKIALRPHPAQIQEQRLNLSFVGSDACANCHQAEYQKWKASPHSHALETLETKAKRPGFRNLDGECVVCHTVGYGFERGYKNAQATPALSHVGCESCHGPGSGHRSAPTNPDLLKLLSPWKKEKSDKLPDVPTLQAQKALPPDQQRTLNAVSRTCSKCHDAENDPHFVLEKYWDKIVHTGLGGPKK
jgi:hypothetical protein